MSGVAQNIEEIYRHYVRLALEMDVFPPHTHLYDYTQSNPAGKTFDDLEYFINEYLEERLDRAWS